MKRKSIGARHEMIIQPAFIIGTYNEDKSPDFAPITWVSKTCEQDEDYLIVISMYGTKKTKQNIQRTKQFSINLVSTGMLTLMDYFGQTSGLDGAKEEVPYTHGRAVCIDAPTLDESRWVKNVQIDERIDVDTNGVDLTLFDPVIYSGNYHSIGEYLGTIGDYYCRK